MSRAASRTCSSSTPAVALPFAPALSRAAPGAAFLSGNAAPLRSVSLRLRRAAPSPAFASNLSEAVTQHTVATSSRLGVRALPCAFGNSVAPSRRSNTLVSRTNLARPRALPAGSFPDYETLHTFYVVACFGSVYYFFVLLYFLSYRLYFWAKKKQRGNVDSLSNVKRQLAAAKQEQAVAEAAAAAAAKKTAEIEAEFFRQVAKRV